MKTYVCLTFIVAALCLHSAEAAAVGKEEINFGTAIRMLLKNFQSLMPCGLEALNIPVLSPVEVNHYGFKANSSDYNIAGSVSNFYISGLKDLLVLDLDYNTTTNRFTFDGLFHQIQLLAQFKIDDIANVAGVPFHLRGEGFMNNKLQDLRIAGEFTLLDADKKKPKGLRVSDFDMKFSLGDAAIRNDYFNLDNGLTNFINKFSSEGILTWVQQIQPYVNEYVRKNFLEPANQALEHMSREEFVGRIVDLAVLFELANCTKV